MIRHPLTCSLAGLQTLGALLLFLLCTWTSAPVWASVTVTNLIVDDSWASGTRTSPPNGASYWSSTSGSGNSIEVYTNELGLISATSGRGNHGIFASQPLAVNETLRATLTFTTPTTVASNKSSAIRFGLFDTAGHLPGLEADLTASSGSPNTNFNNLNGYMMDLDVNTGSENLTIRERNNPVSGRLLATTGDYAALGGGGNSYSLASSTTYTVEFSVTRQATGDILWVGSLYQGASLLSTHSELDTSATATEFGMLGMHAVSGAVGSTNSAGQSLDNGLTFTNIKIETVTTEVPESTLWQQFKAAKVAGTEPILADFSYAGYDYSESPIPDTSGWTVFSVTNYGAIPDDMGYDDAAIQATIDAAEAAGGGVVFFPPGQFRVSPNTNVGDNIFVNGSNILLKGSGSSTNGGTEIFMVNMKVNNGRYMFEVKPNSTSESTITTVVSNSPRESYEVEVANASGLSVHDRVIVRCDSVPYAEAYYAPLTLDPAWTRLTTTSGFNMRELHTVASIDGNTVRFREPIHLPMIIEHNSQPITIQVRSYNVLTNVGVEDILFKGNWDSYPETFVHHKDDIHDYAWDALRFDNVANGWLRDCEFKDWNQNVYFDGCAAFTVSNVRLTGKKGHASIHTRRCYGILVKDCVDTAGHHHGCGVGYWNCGTVYLRHQMAGDQRMDSHSGSPYATLLDGVTGGHFDGNGGPHESYPHHARDFVAWNFDVSGGPNNYNFWPSSRNGHTFALPTFVGLHGKSVTFTVGTITTNELPGTPVEPASLFEAQLAFRLNPDKDEDGLTDDWEITYFGDLTTTSGLETEDYDGDQSIDRDEFLAGTVPTNSQSLLRVEGVSVLPDQGTNDVLLSWQAVNGKSYFIDGSTNLNSAWETLASGILVTNPPGTCELQIEGPTTYFKVGLE